MSKLGRLAVGILLASGSWSCLLYTDPINRPPEVKLMGDTKVTFGAVNRYHAQAHDPDQSADSLTYEWRRWPGGCPVTPEDANTGPPLDNESGPDFENKMAFAQGFCVWVVVRDKEKASDFSTVETEVTHAMAVPALDLLKPTPNPMDRYPLFSALRLSAAKSVDPEKGELTFKWQVTRNAGLLAAQACADAPATDICLDADQPGLYHVVLTVTDGRGVEVTKERTLTIDPDAPPCIRRTEPELLSRLVRDATRLNTFAIQSVEDDGDPLPALPGKASNLSFIATWWHEGEDSNDPPGRRPALRDVDPVVEFKSDYFRNGDRAFVRIQVNDRVPRDFSACARDKVDNCALRKEDPTCFQWVTWKVDFLPFGSM